MVFVGQLMVALCFAELAGRYPVAGSVYNWSKRLAGPTAILRAVVASFVIGGLILLLGILAAPDLSDPALGAATGGLQLIVLQTLGGPLGKAFLVCIVVAITVCALAVHAAATRLMFAMARDNALPAGPTLARIDPRRKAPVAPAVVIGIAAVLILAANLGTPEVFTAVTSVAVIMIYLAYLLVGRRHGARVVRPPRPTPCGHAARARTGRGSLTPHVLPAEECPPAWTTSRASDVGADSRRVRCEVSGSRRDGSGRTSAGRSAATSAPRR